MWSWENDIRREGGGIVPLESLRLRVERRTLISAWKLITDVQRKTPVASVSFCYVQGLPPKSKRTSLI